MQETAKRRKRRKRIAIIGTGGIAAAHVQAFATLADQAEVVAAIDIDQTRATAFAEKWAIGCTGTDLESIVANNDIDLVAICTPPASHMSLALDALAMNLDVIIEKPPALSLRQMRALVAAERASDKTVSCIFQHRFGSGAQRVIDLQTSGDLGRPLVGYCNTLWFRDQAYFDVPWRGLWDVEGGGPTMGHGIHQFDLLLHLWGPWQEVTAFASQLARTTETEDVSMAIVRFESGAMSTVINSVISPRETSQIRLDYEHGTVELEHLYGYGDAQWTFTAAPGFEWLNERWNELGKDVPSGHAAQFKVILDKLAAGQTPPVSAAEAYSTMELIAAIYGSAISKKPVSRNQIDESDAFFSRMDGHSEPWKQEVVTA